MSDKTGKNLYHILLYDEYVGHALVWADSELAAYDLAREYERDGSFVAREFINSDIEVCELGKVGAPSCYPVLNVEESNDAA